MRRLMIAVVLAGCSSSSSGPRFTGDLAGAADLSATARDLRAPPPDLGARDAPPPEDLRRPPDLCAREMGCAPTDMNVSLPEFGLPEFGIPNLEFGLPNIEFGIPNIEFGLPNFDGGLIPCGQIPCFGGVQICMMFGCTQCAGQFCAK
jgi:hypothetical protein